MFSLLRGDWQNWLSYPFSLLSPLGSMLTQIILAAVYLIELTPRGDLGTLIFILQNVCLSTVSNKRLNHRSVMRGFLKVF